MARLSIIIPVYNAEKYISACIDSVLMQSFRDFELILINDGSQDNSGSICDSYSVKDNRIKVIHQGNKGVSEARNTGIDISSGEFITFIDSDDYIEPQYLNNFSFSEDIDFEIQGFEINHIYAPERNLVIKPQLTKICSLKETYVESELKKLSRGPVCKLFRNKIIKQHALKFPADISYGEDAIFVKKYLLCCTGLARTISEASYYYNDYNNTMSLTKRRHSYRSYYTYAWTDYNLYKELEEKMGKFPVELNKDFYKERALEFYWSIVLCITDKNISRSSKVEFFKAVKKEMFLEIKDFKALPITYRTIRWCLLYVSEAIMRRMLELLYKDRIKFN